MQCFCGSKKIRIYNYAKGKRGAICGDCGKTVKGSSDKVLATKIAEQQD